MDQPVKMNMECVSYAAWSECGRGGDGSSHNVLSAVMAVKFYRQLHKPALFVSLLVILFIALFPQALRAADVQLNTDQAQAHVLALSNTSVIGPDAMSEVTGVVRVNMAAGDGNVQQNSAALAKSTSSSVAVINANQTALDSPQDFYQSLSSQIHSGAFNNALGVVMVNQSAGVGNIQFNGVAIAVGGRGSAAIIQLDSEGLESYSANTDVGGGQAEDKTALLVDASSTLSPNAFANAKGIFMINQTAGNNNATANSFTLSVAQ